ncbi:MAG: GNAT family N-acetyltransferase [Enterocloster aldenensis]|uniref:GNAT family N-acetyltransferase n=1 Tax=Enterocloster aldenensis TaxID=358742 RepID=UPI0025A458B6|nr:GNAT family N-acetyltransferase [Enterocloster citroniae]MDM8298513.1 GNAT family protein [Enterocloster aldenensis]
MVIDNGTVILRAIEETDLPFLQEMMNDPGIEKMTGGSCFPVSYDRQKHWFESYNQQAELRLMIQIKGGFTIGCIMLTNIDWKNRSAELAQKTKATQEQRVEHDIWDAMMGFLNYAFNELNLNCVYGTVLEYNYLSRKLAKRCGLKEEGILRDRVFKNGRYHNLIPNSVIKKDFDEVYKKYREERFNEKTR